MKTLRKPEVPSNPERYSSAEQLFIDSIGLVRKTEVSEVPDLTLLLDHNGRQTDFKADNIPRGLSLDTRALPIIHENGTPDRFHFQPQRMLGMGRDDSRHGVFFGSLGMSWFDGRADSTVQVAAKPSTDTFNSRYSRAGFNGIMQEIAINQYLDLLKIPAFKTVGTLALNEGHEVPLVYSITKFDPVTPMDNINWASLSPEQRWEKVGIALSILATLHANLIFHGDPAFKNLGFGQTEGDVRVIDTESCESAVYLNHPSAATGLARIQQCMSSDFSRLTWSIDQDVFSLLPPDQRPQGVDRFEEHVEHVFIPYYERLTKTNSPHMAVLKHALDGVMERKMREAEGLE